MMGKHQWRCGLKTYTWYRLWWFFAHIWLSYVFSCWTKQLDSRAKKAKFLNFSTSVKVYRLWCPDLKKIVLCRDVTFDEFVVFSKATKRLLSKTWGLQSNYCTIHPWSEIYGSYSTGAFKEAIWFHELIEDLGVDQKNINIYCDSQSCWGHV